MGQLGCLEFNSCYVVSLLGAIPLDCRMRQAFPHIPDLPSDTAWSITLVRWLIDVLQAPLLWFFIQFLAKFQRSPNLLSDHMLHFGSLSHASSVFSRMTHLKADDKACAKAGLDFDGTKGLIEKAHFLKRGKAWFMLVKKCLSRIGWQWTCEVWD